MFMRTDAISSWTSSGSDGRLFGITTYHPASASAGSLVTYSVDGDEIVSRVTRVNTNDEPGKLLDAFTNPEFLVPFFSTTVSSLQ